jgi:hypothetical protein
MRNRLPEILAAIAFVLSVAALVFQHFACTDNDAWFDWEQFWHYETFIFAGVVAAVALVAGKYLGRL